VTLRVGVHLPQFGRALTTGGIERAAQHAEALGFSDVWVSDHLVLPEEQAYPAPMLADPLQSLAFAAAATTSIGLGTSVLVGPQYTSPLALANTLASLDFLSGGRLIVGIGIGWSRREYEALGASFDQRGARLDEQLDLFRTAWSEDPATHEGRFYPFRAMRLLPKPANGTIPIWVGGTSDAALARAAAKGDGWHGIGIAPGDVGPYVEKLRASRPEEGFTISIRAAWEPRNVSPEDIAAQAQGYQAAGVDHVVAAPERGSLDTWLASMELIARAAGLEPR